MMGTRSRVSSFMANLTKSRDAPSSPISPMSETKYDPPLSKEPPQAYNPPVAVAPSHSSHSYNASIDSSPKRRRERASSRPMSMIQTYQPSVMDVAHDTLPELQPIFTFLNSHGNKLYQEGYFLKLDDQDNLGRPNTDRTWTECFAQLVGTVLSLWDAAELDTGGPDGEVLPKFMNLTDASIKMIESLPTRSPGEPPLQHVLSISTAGKNRYLFHFNSHHSLIQWTAGIRLAMFEHATLQEAYTGALIAGKGKALNSINLIMERTRIRTEDWARVRFGAGTPWRRCWCVITPPDEKEVQKLQKQVNKKKSAYDRSRPPTLKGDIRFYDTKKTKKVSPIATITNAYSAYAIYPQAKPLIDASTLVKVEGTITIHSSEHLSSTEGFVFVMPEVHPAVSGFEIMLRWLFPVFDIFALYGRPTRLSADTTDPQSLMFGMPKNRRYGYLETLDVAGLIMEQGSSEWRESEWRRRMKDLTSKRMLTMESGSRASSRYSSTGRGSTPRSSFGPPRTRIQFDDSASIRSSPHMGRDPSPAPEPGYGKFPRTDSAPPAPSDPFQPGGAHYRTPSEIQVLDRFANASSNYDGPAENGPAPPMHGYGTVAPREGSNLRYSNEVDSTPGRVSSEGDVTPPDTRAADGLDPFGSSTAPEPVAPPPAFSHGPGALPMSKPWHSPEMRKAKTRMSNGTILQMVGATGASGMAAATSYRGTQNARSSEGQKLESTGEEAVGQSDQRGAPSGVNSQPDGSPSRPQNTAGVARKPLPRDSYVGQALAYGQRPSSSSNSDGHVFDQAPVGMMGGPSDHSHAYGQNANRSDPSTGAYPAAANYYHEYEAHPPAPPSHDSWDRPSTSNSVYEDAIEGPERRRAGVLRTVGNVQEAQYGANSSPNPAIPIVDFGPTYSLNPAQAPSSAALAANAAPAPPQQRGDRSPAFMAPLTQTHSRPQSRPVITPENAHYRTDSSESRTLAWQPGLASSPGVLSPEEFVQQRAAVPPMYAHHRQNSSGNILLPLGNRSADHLGGGSNHSRHSSADLLQQQQRPSSRGASSTLAHRPLYPQQQQFPSDPAPQYFEHRQ